VALVLFDFDGVIADSFGPTSAAMSRAMIAHGYPELAAPEVLLRLVESNWFEGLRAAGVPLAVSDDLDDIVARAAAAGEFQPYDDMPTVVTRVAALHDVVIVTSNRTDIVEAFFVRFGIEGVAEVLGGDKGHSKVDKIAAALRHYRADRSSTWFVGDTAGDVVEGRAAGVATIAVTWGWHARERLEAVAPDRVVTTPDELLALLL
jgi:phosphoglycolate phosphatase